MRNKYAFVMAGLLLSVCLFYTDSVSYCASSTVRNVVADDSLDNDHPGAFQTETEDEVSKENVLELLLSAKKLIAGYPPCVFKNPALQRDLLKRYCTIITLVKENSFDCAIKDLVNIILPRLDGCSACGSPDKDDWITDCDAQNPVQNYTDEAEHTLYLLAPKRIKGTISIYNADSGVCSPVNGATIELYKGGNLLESQTTPFLSDPGSFLFTVTSGDYIVKASYDNKMKSRAVTIQSSSVIKNICLGK